MERLDLDEIEREWLVQCGICEFGVLGPCVCPPGDPRVIIQKLIEEIRFRRKQLSRIRVAAGPPGG